MAIETPLATPTTEPTTGGSPIENELTTYRAIAPSAVASLIAGVVAGLAFASYWFLIASGLALALGFLALYKIRQQPDALTGGGMAKAGIALGLVFGLSSTTISYVSDRLIAREAEQFVRVNIVQLVNDRDLSGALWYKMPPEERRGMTPEQSLQQIKGAPDADPMAYERVAGGITRLIEQTLKLNPNAEAHFERIEKAGYDGITPWAVALVRIDGVRNAPVTPQTADDGRAKYLGVVIKREGTGANEAWWVSDFHYPYEPATHKEALKKVDDGHGH